MSPANAAAILEGTCDIDQTGDFADVEEVFEAVSATHGQAAEWFDVFAWNALAATARWNDGEFHVNNSLRNVSTTWSCWACVRPWYMGRLMASA